MKKIFIFFWLLSGFSRWIWASGVSVISAANKRQITIGEKINYTVTVRYPADYSLIFSSAEVIWDNWVLEKQDITRSKQARQENLKIIFTLTTFSTGQFFLPAISFTYILPSGETGTVAGSSVPVNVESLLARYGDRGDIRDIKKPLSLSNWFWYFLAGLILLGGLIALAIYTQKKLPDTEIAVARNDQFSLSPVDEANQRLEELFNSGLLASGQIKEFYIGLTEIVRRFFERTYSVDLWQKTSSEIYRYLRHRAGARRELSLVRDFFTSADLVKFAGWRPTEKECGMDWERAKTIVKNFSNASG